MPYNEPGIAGKDSAPGHLAREGARECASSGEAVGEALAALAAVLAVDDADREIDGRVLADIRALPLEAVRASLLADARALGFDDVAAALAA